MKQSHLHFPPPPLRYENTIILEKNLERDDIGDSDPGMESGEKSVIHSVIGQVDPMWDIKFDFLLSFLSRSRRWRARRVVGNDVLEQWDDVQRLLTHAHQVATDTVVDRSKRTCVWCVWCVCWCGFVFVCFFV